MYPIGSYNTMISSAVLAAGADTPTAPLPGLQIPLRGSTDLATCYLPWMRLPQQGLFVGCKKYAAPLDRRLSIQRRHLHLAATTDNRSLVCVAR